MSTNVKPTSPCPSCGKLMPAGALAGFCPACLLAQGADTEPGDAPGSGRFQPPSLEEIARLFPQLEILGLLGAGGMGAVYKARQPALDRFVALKILPGKGVSGANFEERFNREARALARLSHPNIVAVFEFGRTPPQTPDAIPHPLPSLHFFIMEFVDGANLRQLEQSARLAPREALQLIPQICDALQYAHDEGVVHRDIKPENVLVDRKGRVKIADFGLAKILGVEADTTRLTAEGQVMGTPHYMAPEQIEKPLTVDHRADIYSLGVVLYEMLTGDLPLGKFAPPSRKYQLDVRLDDVVLRALENDPARRYQHASEVKSQVENIAGTPAPSAAAPASSTDSLPRTAHGTAILPAERFSRKAIGGACWAAFFLVAPVLAYWAVLSAGTNGGADPFRPVKPWYQHFPVILMLVPFLAAPFATTILGWLAVADIRHSRGRISGLRLAVFDGLLFPLLALDAVLSSVLVYAARRFLSSELSPALNASHPVWIMLAATLVCLTVDYLIIRRVWSAVRLDGNPSRSDGDWWWDRKSGAVMIGLACAVIILVSATRRVGYERPFVHQVAERDVQTGRLFANLPGRGKVELLAVGERDAALNGWWTPDGSPITNHTFEIEGSVRVPAEGRKEIAMIFAKTDLPPGADRMSFEADTKLGVGMGGQVIRDSKRLSSAWQAGLATEPGQRAVTVRLSFTLEAWRTIATDEVLRQSMSESRLPTDPRWEVQMIRPPYGSKDNAHLSLSFHPGGRLWDHRVVAVDTNGIEHVASSASSTRLGKQTMWNCTWMNLPMPAVIEFRLQVRPLHWVEFREVVLQPSAPVPPPQPVRFGPLVEQTFSDLIDFDTGKTSGFPPASAGSKPEAGLGESVWWARENGFDAEAGVGELNVMNMEFVALNAADWDALSAPQVIDRLHRGSLYAPLQLKPLQNRQLPATFAFRTRERGIGLLQLVGFQESPARATVRYKLVSKPPVE